MGVDRDLDIGLSDLRRGLVVRESDRGLDRGEIRGLLRTSSRLGLRYGLSDLRRGLVGSESDRGLDRADIGA